jgi:hypothetical protein
MSVQSKYFVFAIIVVGTIGIWLPFILAIPLDKDVPVSAIPINLTTFYISIYFAGCVEYMLKILDDLEVHNIKSKVLNIIGLILLSLALTLTTIWLYVEKEIFISTVLATIGAIIALRLWWINNTNNPTFNERVRSEGNSKHGKNW